MKRTGQNDGQEGDGFGAAVVTESTLGTRLIVSAVSGRTLDVWPVYLCCAFRDSGDRRQSWRWESGASPRESRAGPSAAFLTTIGSMLNDCSSALAHSWPGPAASASSSWP